MAKKGPKPKREIAKPAPQSQPKLSRSASEPSQRSNLSQSLGNKPRSPSTPSSPSFSTTISTPGQTAGPSSKHIPATAEICPIPKFTASPKAQTSRSKTEKTENSKKEAVESLLKKKKASASVIKSNEKKRVTAEETEPALNSPLKRLRKQPRRFESRETGKKTQGKKSMFAGISRDSLHRYMVHYNIPKRQDLKKNLVARVDEHFATLNASDINLEELNNGVRARLRKLNEEPPKKGRK